MTKWPNWYAGLALGVEHLVGLEDYLLARVRMGDQCGHGVDYFNWQTSVTMQKDEGKQALKVTGPIKGVTPGGHPVVIDAGEVEVALLDVPSQGEFVFDLTIEIHPNDAKSRIHIKATPTTAKANAIKSDQANALYLGRFRFTNEVDKELLKKPLLRRFSSLQPPDEIWVRPFVARLTEVLRLLQKEAQSGNRAAATSLTALSEVAFDWAHWDLPQLGRRLQYALWLASGKTEPQAIGHSSQPALSFPPSDVVGHAIPSLLADLLVVPAMPKMLPELLDQLLYGLYLKVPIRDFFTWEEYLSRTGGDTNIDTVAKVLREALKRKQFTNWSRAIGLITMARLQENSQYEWPPEIIRGYQNNPKNSLAIEVGSIVRKLYENEARQAPAGPLGFYCLARAARGLASNIQDADELLYYFRLVTAKARLQAGQQPWHLNRVLEFLEQRTRLMTDFSHRDTQSPPPDAKWTPIAPPEQTIPEVRVRVLGEKRSGKSALIRAYVALLGGGKISAGTSSSIQGTQSAVNDDESVASCQIRATKITFRFIENSIESGSQSASNPLVPGLNSNECDAAILVIDPESIDVARDLRPTGLISLLTLACRALKKREPFMALIVYSKSDEYGVLNPDVVRVAGNAVNGSTAKAWPDFLEKATSTGSDAKWNECRNMVLTETRDFWTEVSAITGASITGYFVAAQPVETGARFGILESLNDLCDHSIQNVGSRH